MVGRLPGRKSVKQARLSTCHLKVVARVAYLGRQGTNFRSPQRALWLRRRFCPAVNETAEGLMPPAVASCRQAPSGRSRRTSFNPFSGRSESHDFSLNASAADTARHVKAFRLEEDEERWRCSVWSAPRAVSAVLGCVRDSFVDCVKPEKYDPETERNAGAHCSLCFTCGEKIQRAWPLMC